MQHSVLLKFVATAQALKRGAKVNSEFMLLARLMRSMHYCERWIVHQVKL